MPGVLAAAQSSFSLRDGTHLEGVEPRKQPLPSGHSRSTEQALFVTVVGFRHTFLGPSL
jgi:hypothetical protein